MKTAGKILTAVICVAVVAGGSIGGTLLYRTRQAEKNRVEVYAVSALEEYNWGNTLSMDGTVQAGNTQNVILSSDQLIEKVLVKEGDKVTAGTPLIQYDQTAVELDTAQKKTALAVAEDTVRQQKKELERLKGLKSSEEAPADPVYPDDDNGDDGGGDDVDPEEPDDMPAATLAQVQALTQAAAGDGSAENPYQFACTGTTVVLQTVLEQLRGAESCAVFVIYDENGNSLYAWLVRGSSLSSMTLADWTLGSQVTVTEDGGVQISGGGSWYGTIQVGGTFTYDPASEPTATTTAPAETNSAEETTTETTSTESSTEPETEEPSTDSSTESTAQAEPTAALQPLAAITLLSSTGTDSDNYVYTKAQLKQKIAEQELQIQAAEIEQKKAQIAYDSAVEKQTNGQEVAKIDGTVTKLADSVEELEQNEPYLTVQGTGSVLISGSVSEMNLEKFVVGSVISVNSWETGETVTATVTKVDATPTSYTGQNYGENPNNSMYSFQAEVTEENTLSVDSYVDISLEESAELENFYLPVSYVRQEDGQYYVMKKGADGTLEKQIVQTGRIINSGYSIEILSGLSEEDWICFPYGKYATEGAKTKDSENVYE